MNDDPGNLANLRDVALPAPAPWWPPAPGWWIVAAAACAVLLWVVWVKVRRYRVNAYRRAALRELAALDGRADVAAEVSAILKRTALVVFPRGQVAGLSGAAWLEFLDRTGRTSTFTTGPAHHMPNAVFGAESAFDDGSAREIVKAARAWIIGHRPPGQGG
jgi:Domain of unknown function (DUF4381)